MCDGRTMTDEIRHEPDHARYVLVRGDDRLGVAEYVLHEGVIRFVHTQIDADVEDRGLGSKLVAGALDDVRRTGERRVEATCPFVAHFLETHEEYADLTR